MTTPTKEPKARRFIRAPRTQIQKVRDMALTLFGVEKKDIAAVAGVTLPLISNVFSDRHRSPDVEQSVIDYLNSKYTGLTAWEKARLKNIGVAMNGQVTLDEFGWPEPEDA